MVNAQEWLDANYPKEIRSKIKNLFIREKNLEGNLDLIGFTKLEKLDCSYNELTSLKFHDSTQLKRLDCNDNCLTSLDYSSLSIDKLIFLDLSNNYFETQNLSHFNKFTNLHVLWVGNSDEEKIKKGIYNRFNGSLKPLKNLANLEEIHISNTDIDSGVDCLPNDSIERIYYSFKERPESKIKEIADQLNSFLNRKIKKDWKDIRPSFDEYKQKEWSEKLGFSHYETDQWINIVGLQPNDYQFAAYLRAKGCSPDSGLNLESLRKETKSVQEWFNSEYPLEERKWINWLDISRSGLKGDLIITDFPNLEKLDCYHNQLTSLTLSNLPRLNRFNPYNNKLNSLTIKNSKVNSLNVRNNFLTSLDFLNSLNSYELTTLNVGNNKFSPRDITDFGKFRNLRSLYLADNFFYGNLQCLENLNKLEVLDISNTNICKGLEHLPSSLRKIYCDSREGSYNCSMIKEQLQKHLWGGGNGYDFFSWREDNKRKNETLVSEQIMIAQNK